MGYAFSNIHWPLRMQKNKIFSLKKFSLKIFFFKKKFFLNLLSFHHLHDTYREPHWFMNIGHPLQLGSHWEPQWWQLSPKPPDWDLPPMPAISSSGAESKPEATILHSLPLSYFVSLFNKIQQSPLGSAQTQHQWSTLSNLSPLKMC
jgi:hypothetical protein